jgi:hypothetical protein
MRKALVIGIDYYSDLTPLSGCVADAVAVGKMLGRNADNTVNFLTPKIVLARDVSSAFKRRELKDSVEALFADKSEVALLYFAGHGFIDATGGFLCSSDCKDGDDGLPIADIMQFARKSNATNKVIILDSCHAGIAGSKTVGAAADIGTGMTILTASTAEQYAFEGGNGAPGVFTNLLVNALGGAAANLVGDVTPGSAYAHIDQSLGSWGGQRPVFKTNVESFVSLRRAKPPIAHGELVQLATHFPQPNFRLALDPSFEPERSPDLLNNPNIPLPNPVNTKIF